jgi:hypothetical protein
METNMFFALYLCLYHHQADIQDTCTLISPGYAIFSREDCYTFLRTRGYRDSTRGATKLKYVCGETFGTPGKSLICDANLKSCHRYTVPAPYPENDQEPKGTETGPGT